MQFLLFVAGALALASPSLAQRADPPDAEMASLASEMQGYGQWLVRANEIQAPITNALQGLQARWQEAMATHGPEAAAAAFRPVVAEIAGLVDRTNAQLDALPTPEFATLDLASDLQPRTLVREMRRLNDQVKTFVETYNPLLDAMIRNDAAAVQQAGRQMVRGLDLIFESQILLARGGLASTPREDSTWEMQNIQLLYFSVGSRLLRAWPENSVAGIDRALARDLRDFAARIDATASDGSTKLEADLTTLRDDLAAAERDGDAASAAIFRRTIAVIEIDRAIFSTARELSSILRDHAGRLEDGRITLESITRVFLDLQRIRGRMDDIVTQEALALSGSD